MTLSDNNPIVIKNRLIQAFDEHNNIVDMGIVVESISLLEKIHITREDLEQTRLGKYVNDIRKKLSVPTQDVDTPNTKNIAQYNELAKRAKALVKKWRDDHLRSELTLTNINDPHINSQTVNGAIMAVSTPNLLQHGIEPKVVKGKQQLNGHVSTFERSKQLLRDGSNSVHHAIIVSSSLDMGLIGSEADHDKPKLVLKIKKQPKVGLQTSIAQIKIPPSNNVKAPYIIPPPPNTTQISLLPGSNGIHSQISSHALPPACTTRKVKTTAELMAKLTAKSKVLQDIPLAPYLLSETGGPSNVPPPNLQLITKSHQRYLNAKKHKVKVKPKPPEPFGPVLQALSIDQNSLQNKPPGDHSFVIPQPDGHDNSSSTPTKKKRGRHKRARTDAFEQPYNQNSSLEANVDTNSISQIPKSELIDTNTAQDKNLSVDGSSKDIITDKHLTEPAIGTSTQDLTLTDQIEPIVSVKEFSSPPTLNPEEIYLQYFTALFNESSITPSSNYEKQSSPTCNAISQTPKNDNNNINNNFNVENMDITHGALGEIALENKFDDNVIEKLLIFDDDSVIHSLHVETQSNTSNYINQNSTQITTEPTPLSLASSYTLPSIDHETLVVLPFIDIEEY